MAATDSPTRLGDRYLLGPVIGRGGMGEVLAAHDERLGRDVAIKFLREDLARQPDLRRRFEAEARAAARLSHPSIVAIFDTGETEDGIPFIVMERLPGRTLSDAIAEAPLTPAAARRVATQVLDALCVAHEAGIVHRDVKPGNVLLTDEGNAKVADFGIAKSVDDDQTTGVLLGTAAYVAPERLTGARATPASDCYSVGVVLYEALSGRKPFVGDSPIAVVRAVQHGDAEPLDVDDRELRAVIERSMAKDPARRFASARDMAAALDPETYALPGAAPARTAGGAGEVTEPVERPQPPARTSRLDPPARRAARAARRSRQRTPMSRRRRALLVGALAALFVVSFVVALVVTGGDDDPTPASSTEPTATTVPVTQASTPGGDAQLPPRLERDLRDLEEQIRP